MNQELAVKQERLARLKKDIEDATAEAELLSREIEVDTEELASKDPKVIWRRAFGTPLTYQALCDFFRAASPEVQEAAAQLLYSFARSGKNHQYAYWALRFWHYWTKGERTLLMSEILMSTDTDAHISASKVFLLDDLWGRSMYYFRGDFGRTHLFDRWGRRNDVLGAQYVLSMQRWTKAPLLPQELNVLQSMIAAYAK